MLSKIGGNLYATEKYIGSLTEKGASRCAIKKILIACHFFSLNYVAFLLSGFTFSSEFEILHIWWSVIAFLIIIQRPFRYSHQVDLAPLNFYYCVNIAYYTSIWRRKYTAITCHKAK